MTEPEILFDRRGPLGLVTLNRPKALNALTLDMIRAFDAQLAAWQEDAAVRAVVVRGAGGKAFCAGGDVVAMYREGVAERAGETVGTLRRDFFRSEYGLNRRIKRFPKPYIPLVDGISMGGGMGISMHASHRVVTERTMIAMPETGIGLFPDVGGTHFLPRCPGGVGLYLGLTGERLKGVDVVEAGIGDALVPSERLDSLVDAIAASGCGADEVMAILRAHAAPAIDAPLAALRPAIDRCFAGSSVEAIMAALVAEGTEWARGVLAIFGRVAPTSLKVTLEAIRRGAGLEFEDCMVMEYRLSQSFLAADDFYEGVRALLVDKDKNPRWNPATLDAVDTARVERYFASPPAGDLSFG